MAATGCSVPTSLQLDRDLLEPAREAERRLVVFGDGRGDVHADVEGFVEREDAARGSADLSFAHLLVIDEELADAAAVRVPRSREFVPQLRLSVRHVDVGADRVAVGVEEVEVPDQLAVLDKERVAAEAAPL